MLKESQRLQSEITSLSNQLSTYPEGKLVCSHTGKYIKWFVSDGKNHTYIPKKNRKFAEQLASKKYLSCHLEDLQNEKRAIDFYLRHHRSDVNQVENLLKTKPAFQELLTNFQSLSQQLNDWVHEPYESNPKYPEQLIHKIPSGIYVRSKSEAMIAMYLFYNKIPFRYEAQLTLGPAFSYPDFTIRNPSTGDTIYWEHFGMMDDPSYVRNTFSKLQLYSSYKIIPSINLITTYETKSTPLSSEMIEKIIEYYFL